MAQEQGRILQGGDDTATLRGTESMDLLSAISGDNLLLGRGASDALAAGTGADTLRGGSGDDLLFVTASTAIADGGPGIDTVILAPNQLPYTFTPGNLAGIEAIQDGPGRDSSVVFDARILENADDDSFLFALGDGFDEVRITNFGGDAIEIQGDEVAFNGVVLRFEGVESLTVVGGDGTSSSVVTQSLSSGIGNSTTVLSTGDGSGTSTTITSVTTTGQATAPAGDEPSPPPEAVAGPGSAAFLAAEALHAALDDADSVDLGGLAEQMFGWLEQHAEAADALRAEDAVAASEAEAQDVLGGSLFGTEGLFGLLSADSLLRLSESDLFSAG